MVDNLNHIETLYVYLVYKNQMENSINSLLILYVDGKYETKMLARDILNRIIP